METIVKKLYEGMFLVDAAEAEADWDGVVSNVKDILGRVGAEIISLRKWDTRRLAYAVDKKNRGTYILCYFRVDGTRVREIERTVQLSERIMRVLILSADHLTQEDIEKDTPAVLAVKPREEVSDAAAGRVSAAEDYDTDAEVPELAEAAEEAAAELADEPESGVEGLQPEDEIKDDFGSADERDTEKSPETGQ